MAPLLISARSGPKLAGLEVWPSKRLANRKQLLSKPLAQGIPYPIPNHRPFFRHLPVPLSLFPLENS